MDAAGLNGLGELRSIAALAALDLDELFRTDRADRTVTKAARAHGAHEIDTTSSRFVPSMRRSQSQPGEIAIWRQRLNDISTPRS
jgi:hypothetical protein